MAKKVLYKRVLESQRSYWPVTFEDISDDERDELLPAPVVADYYHYALDFSTKKEVLSPAPYPAKDLNCVGGAFQDPRFKEVPINLKIKQEPLDMDEESDLIIDTTNDEDERLLQDWNEDSDLSVNDEKKDDIPENSIVIAPQEMTSMKLEPQYDASPYCQTQSIEQFNCSFCTRKYWKFSKLKDHINSHHFGKKKSAKKNNFSKTVDNYDDKRNFVSKCPDCNKQLQTKTDMYVHRLTHRHPSFAQIPCMLCKENQLTYGALKTHVREKHAINEKWFCPICPDVRTFTQNHSLLIHISTFHFDANKQPPAQYSCRKCQRTFTSKGLLGKHLSYAHFSSSYKVKQYKMFQCESCKDFFEDFETLEKHSPCFEEKKNSDHTSPFCIPRQKKCSPDFFSLGLRE